MMAGVPLAKFALLASKGAWFATKCNISVEV